MDSFFKISQRSSSVATELVGGLTTFLAMAYIIAVNPAMLAAAGVPLSAALTATCLGAALVTLLMGLVANRPIALASGMGLNAVVAYGICLGQGVDWRVAMAVVFLEGVLILLFVVCGLRKAVMNAIPQDLRMAIGLGIGLFIAFIGLQGSGIITASESTLIALGDLTSPGCIVALVSLAVVFVLWALNVKGSLLISIVVAVVVGIPLGVTPLPTSWEFGLDFSGFAAPFQTDPTTGTMALFQVFAKPVLLLFVFSLFMSDFFDTMGFLVAEAKQAEFMKEDGDIEDLQSILVVDSLGAVAGGFLGCSSITSYSESLSGAAAGARTGLSSVVCALLFVVFAFMSPLVAMVTSSATCGALVIVGYIIMRDVSDINWKDIRVALPAFLIVIGIPLTYSITDGIGIGFICYCLIMVATGNIKQIKPLMWIASAAFVVMFVLT